MGETIKFVVNNFEAVPKGRPRFAISNGGGHSYTPPKTRVAEQELVLLSRRYAPSSPFDCPLAVRLEFKISRPKKPSREFPRPDIDNYIKLVFDAYNGIFWNDDKQIVKVVATKEYTEQTPCIIVEIEETKNERI
jgi:Holliday junction resolvase RusA-like endonuclease